METKDFEQQIRKILIRARNTQWGMAPMIWLKVTKDLLIQKDLSVDASLVARTIDTRNFNKRKVKHTKIFQWGSGSEISSLGPPPCENPDHYPYYWKEKT